MNWSARPRVQVSAVGTGIGALRAHLRGRVRSQPVTKQILRQGDGPTNDVDNAKDLCRRRDPFCLVRPVDRNCLDHVIRFAKRNPRIIRAKQADDAENQLCVLQRNVRSFLGEYFR